MFLFCLVFAMSLCASVYMCFGVTCWERAGAFTNRNGQEWTSITGMDLKIHPKIHVLSVLDKKFWLSNVKYQISSVSRQFQCKKDFLKYFLPYPHILVPYYLRLTYTSHL